LTSFETLNLAVELNIKLLNTIGYKRFDNYVTVYIITLEKTNCQSRMDNPEKLTTSSRREKKKKNQQQKPKKKPKQNKKITKQYALDITIHKTKDDDKQNRKHNTIRERIVGSIEHLMILTLS